MSAKTMGIARERAESCSRSGMDGPKGHPFLEELSEVRCLDFCIEPFSSESS